MRWNRLLLPLAGVALVLFMVHQARGGAAPAPPPPAEAAGTSADDAGPSRVLAEGRVVAYPGAEVTVGSEVAGVLARVTVEERQAVRRGELIAELRADDTRAELAEAGARVAEAEADLRLYELEVERAERLVSLEVAAERDADLARRNRDATRARRETALAVVRRLEAVLAKTRIVAPLDGVVTAKHVDRGEHVESGDPLVTIVDLGRTRVEAEVDEFDSARVGLGASATVTAEGWTGDGWRGSVEEIPDQVVARLLDPQDPGRPSDTRVLKVKVALAEPTPLKLGQRVEVEIAIR